MGEQLYTEQRPILLPICGALILGLWGMGRTFLSPAALAAALAVGALLILADRRRKWVNVALVGAGLCALLAGFFLKEGIGGGLGAMGNQLARILTERTGYYFYAFETNGETVEASLAVGVLLGAFAAWAVRAGNSFPALGAAAVVFFACLFGILQNGLWLAVFLLGLILVLAKNASGTKGVLWTAAMAIAFGGIVMLALNGTAMEPPEQALDAIHHWRYEETENPLPEGDISGAGRFAPTADAALEVTMTDWTGLYLRGFVGTDYIDGRWETTEGETLAQSADLLYTLQKSYFYPEQQLSAANSALENTAENQISVRVLGACGAYGYLPYGIGGVSLDPRNLNAPQLDAYSGTLYPLDEAYLIQKELSDGAGEQRYLDAEAAYREWVYANCLAVPGNLRGLPESTEELTTTEAKELVLTWLQDTLKYDEYAPVSGDAAQALLTTSPYGYSIHYATLGTLALRNLGIPARYVEGYAVSRSDAAALGAGEKLTVTQEQAHAWVEYYLDGVGWVPFEVTPGHENELVYQLPPDGSGLQDPEPEEPEPSAPEEPPVKQQPDPGSQTRLHMSKLVRNVILILLLLAVLGDLIRVLILRKRLKETIARFRTEPDRERMLECLRYQMELLESMGLPKRNAPILDMELDISRVLTGIDVRPVLLTAQELSFSNHPVTEEQHRLVTEALDRVLEIWNQQLPLLKRLGWKWLRCKVL